MFFLNYRIKKYIIILVSLLTLVLGTWNYTKIIRAWLILTETLFNTFSIHVMLVICVSIGVISFNILTDNIVYIYRFRRRHGAALEGFSLNKLVKRYLIKELNEFVELIKGKGYEKFLHLKDLSHEFRSKFDISNRIPLEEIITKLLDKILPGNTYISLKRLRKLHLELKYKKAAENAAKIRKSQTALDSRSTPDSINEEVDDEILDYNDNDNPEDAEIEETELKELYKSERVDDSQQRERMKYTDTMYELRQKGRSIHELLKLTQADYEMPSRHNVIPLYKTISDVLDTMLLEHENSTPQEYQIVDAIALVIDMITPKFGTDQSNELIAKIEQKRFLIDTLEKSNNDECKELAKHLRKLTEIDDDFHSQELVLVTEARRSVHSISEHLNKRVNPMAESEKKLVDKQKVINSLMKLIRTPSNELTEDSKSQKVNFIEELSQSENLEDRRLAEQCQELEQKPDRRSSSESVQSEGLEQNVSNEDFQIFKRKECYQSIRELLTIYKEDSDAVRGQKTLVINELAESTCSEERMLARLLLEQEIVEQNRSENEMTMSGNPQQRYFYEQPRRLETIIEESSMEDLMSQESEQSINANTDDYDDDDSGTLTSSSLSSVSREESVILLSREKGPQNTTV